MHTPSSNIHIPNYILSQRLEDVNIKGKQQDCIQRVSAFCAVIWGVFPGKTDVFLPFYTIYKIDKKSIEIIVCFVYNVLIVVHAPKERKEI